VLDVTPNRDAAVIVHWAMTAFRLISLPLHGAFEFVAGLALALTPFALGASPAAAVAAVAAGALMIGMALSKAAESVPVTTQYSYDWGLASGLVGGAAVLGLAGQPVAMLVLATAALVQLALNLVTRYSATR
jgi:hypothetical protein